MDLIQSITEEYKKTDIPEFSVGDTVRVPIKVREGNKERIQVFEGFVLKLYEQSFHKDYLILSRKFDPYNFNLLYELVMDIGRRAVIVFLFLCFDDPKIMIYVNFAIMSLGLLFKFKTTIRKTANR